MERIPLSSPAPALTVRQASARIRRLIRYLSEKRKLLVYLAVITLLSIALDLTLPLLVEGSVDALGLFGSRQRNMHIFYRCLVLFFGNILLSALLGYLHDVLCARVTIHLTKTLRTSLFSKTVRLGADRTERLLPGDVMSRIMNDADMAARAVSETLLTLFSSLIVIIGCGVLMLYKSPLLGGLSVAATLLSVFVTGFLSGMLMPRMMRRQAALGRLNTHADESVRGLRTCLTGGKYKENIDRMQALSTAYYKDSIRAARLEKLLEPLMMLFGNINFILIILFGSRQVLAGALSIGTLQAFVLLSRQFMEPVGELGGCMAQLQSALACAERIFDILDQPDEGEKANRPERKPDTADNAELALCGVSFSYRNRRPVLQDISLCVGKGEKLAIVGETGAGKTTLMKLIAGMYQDYEGGIYQRGTEIRSLGLETLRSRIILIAQEPQLIDGTILENIAYGVPGATEKEIISCAREIGLDPAIRLLPEGYRTRISQAGSALSQGQLQMLCLTRVMLRKESLVILDEAVSSVDAATQDQIKKALDQVLRGRTCLIIAHNPAFVRDADRIIVLDSGRIAEEGTHRQLMEADGLYAAAYRRQYGTDAFTAVYEST